jgi:hypothetical protein
MGRPDREHPEPLVNVDLRELNAFVADEDGDLVVVVSDGDHAITFEPGVGRNLDAAIKGAETGAEALLLFADMLRTRRGDRKPISQRVPATPWQWPQNTTSSPRPSPRPSGRRWIA